MAILNMFGGAGGGVRIPLESPTAFTASPQAGKVVLTWTDPVDKVASPGGEMVAPWSYTIVVRKVGSYPQTPKDGVEVTRETTRNQYQTTGFEDTLSIENGITYYYALFAVSTFGVWSEPATDTAMPTAAHPQFYKSQKFSYVDGQSEGIGDVSLSSTTNHFVFAGGGYTPSYNTVYVGDTFALDKNLSKTPLVLNLDATKLTPEKFGQHAIFIQGETLEEDYSVTFTTISESLSKSSVYNPIPEGRAYSAGVGCSDSHVIIAGGTDGAHDGSKELHTYDTNFTHSYGADLPLWCCYTTGVHIGDHVLFSGGKSGPYGSTLPTAFAFSSNLTRVDNLAQVYQMWGGVGSGIADGPIGHASNGSYAIFASGIIHVGAPSEDLPVGVVTTAYDQSLTRQPQLSLSSSPYIRAIGGEVDEFAMFGYDADEYGETVAFDCFDNVLTRLSNMGTVSQLSFNDARYMSAGSGTVDNMVLFGKFLSSNDGQGVYAFQCV